MAENDYREFTRVIKDLTEELRTNNRLLQQEQQQRRETPQTPATQTNQTFAPSVEIEQDDSGTDERIDELTRQFEEVLAGQQQPQEATQQPQQQPPVATQANQPSTQPDALQSVSEAVERSSQVEQSAITQTVGLLNQVVSLVVSDRQQTAARFAEMGRQIQQLANALRSTGDAEEPPSRRAQSVARYG